MPYKHDLRYVQIDLIHTHIILYAIYYFKVVYSIASNI